jgi:signal transduction histidine kinase
MFSPGPPGTSRRRGDLASWPGFLLSVARAALVRVNMVGYRRRECRPRRHGCEHFREALRLRRNLHDGLGPALAGMIMGVDVVRSIVRDDPHKAERILAELQGEATEVMAEFHWALACRGPRELDEHDLDEAVGTLARRLVATSGSRLTIDVDVTADVAHADRRAKVIAFWVIKEALSNVVKHACASFCSVRVWVDDGLRLEVVDNGRGGVGLGSAGMGLASMAHRASEIGGWCDIRDGNPGVVVSACLPTC